MGRERIVIGCFGSFRISGSQPTEHRLSVNLANGPRPCHHSGLDYTMHGGDGKCNSKWRCHSRTATASTALRSAFHLSPYATHCDALVPLLFRGGPVTVHVGSWVTRAVGSRLKPPELGPVSGLTPFVSSGHRLFASTLGVLCCQSLVRM